MFLAAAGSGLLIQRYFAARRRILVDTDPSESATWRDGLSQKEQGLLTKPVQAFAEGEGAVNGHHLDLRIRRLERVAARQLAAGDTRAQSTKTEADRLSAGLEIALVEGAATLLEYRSARVYRGPLTIIYALAIAVGVGGMYFVADWSHGESQRITTFVDCLENAPDDLESLLCSEYDPRRVPRQSSEATPTPTSSSSQSASEPSVNPAPLRRLYQCSAIQPTPTVTVPVDLRNQALARCAGLTAPTPTEPSAGATPYGAPSR